MTDQELIQKAQKDYEAMQADRDAWKKHCFTARSRRERWEKLAMKYKKALEAIQENPARATIVVTDVLEEPSVSLLDEKRDYDARMMANELKLSKFDRFERESV